MARFAFVVLHYLAEDLTITCVENILARFTAPDQGKHSVHVVVVDNGSPNGSGDRLAMRWKDASDVTVLLTTFLLTVVFDLTIAIEMGLVIACALFIKRVMETTEISVIKDEIDPSEDADMTLSDEHLTIPKGCAVYEINGPYFFGIANKFDDLQTNLAHGNKPRVQIIRMRKVPFIDSTGIHNLQNLIEMNHENGTHVILSGVTPKVHSQLEKAGFYQRMNPDHICPHIDVALERARKLLAAL